MISGLIGKKWVFECYPASKYVLEDPPLRVGRPTLKSGTFGVGKCLIFRVGHTRRNRNANREGNDHFDPLGFGIENPLLSEWVYPTFLEWVQRLDRVGRGGII